MSNVCILTDSTAQFTQSDFPGHERVHITPFKFLDTARPKDRSLPGSLPAQKQLAPPSPQDFIRYFTGLSREYDSILVLTLSSFLGPTMSYARVASDQCKYLLPVEVIDSQTTAVGLGMLVQIAAGAASEGASLKEIDRRLRASIPRVYMLFCIPELTYLAHSGLMDYAPAVVAEMMGMLPIFCFEEGRLVPLEKVRTPRHLSEAFEDFMNEFENPSHIALVRSTSRGSPHMSPLRQFIDATFPETPFSEHTLQPHLAALLGPRSTGLVIMESEE